MAKLRDAEHVKSRFRRREKPRGERCLNCGAEIQDRYCPHCGQENAPADLTLGAVLKEFFAELLFYDSKLWRTLRMLVRHPGRLSTEWATGKRTMYLSPIRLYLSITFLFFVFVAWTGGTGLRISRSLTESEQQELLTQLPTQQLNPKLITLIREELNKSKVKPDMRVKLDAALDKAESDAEARVTSGAPSVGDQAFLNSTKLKGWPGALLKKVEAAAMDDPVAFGRHFIEQIPKVLFIILPLFAVVLKVLYVRQKRFFVEHLVFILHLHSFAFLVLLLAQIIAGRIMPTALVIPIVMFWLPIYAFVAMLRFYCQPWWLTGIKGLILNTAYLSLVVGGLFLGALFTATGYDDPKPVTATRGKPGTTGFVKPNPPTAPTLPIPKQKPAASGADPSATSPQPNSKGEDPTGVAPN